MKTLRTFVTAAFILCALFSKANQPDPIRGLNIGDKVPAIAIAKMMAPDGTVKSINLSDYNDRLLILDLMNTNCSACLAGLPKKDTLQQKFGDKIKVVVVTEEEETYMRDYFKNSKTYLAKQHVQLPWIVEDDLLKKYFPHQYISHLVWIYKGKVVAITLQEYVDAKNIQDILDGKKIDLPIKRDDIGFDYTKQSLFNVSPNWKTGESLSFYYSSVSGQQSGLNRGEAGYRVDTINKVIRLFSVNQPALVTYSRAYGGAYGMGAKPFIGPGRLILEVKDPSNYIYKPGNGYQDTWLRNHEICYEGTFPLSMKKEDCYQQMILDLNRFLGLHARWELRKVPALVIVQVQTAEQVAHTKEAAKQHPYFDTEGRFHEGTKHKDDGTIAKEQTVGFLKTVYESTYQNEDLGTVVRPLVDKTNYAGTFLFPLGLDFKNIPSLRKALQACGFDLIEREEETDMFVVTELR